MLLDWRAIPGVISLISNYLAGCGSSKMATTRLQPAEAARIFTGKQLTRNPESGNNSKLCSFSMCV
jgi:hypothetical protein